MPCWGVLAVRLETRRALSEVLQSRFMAAAYMYRFLYDTNDWDADNMGLCSGALDKRSKWL